MVQGKTVEAPVRFRQMESKEVAALVSSLTSHLLLLLLLFLFPNSSPFSFFPSSTSPPNNSHQTNPIFYYFLASHGAAATTSLSLVALSRKRKRTHFSPRDSEPTHVPGISKLGHLGPRLGDSLRFFYSPDSFMTAFKMKSSTFEWLAGLLDPLLDCRDPIGSPLNLSAELRLAIGLFRLTTGSSYVEIGQRFGVTESVSRFCVRRLCRVLCTNFRFWVGFPSPNELALVSKRFEDLTGLPNCCGVIDCARFSLCKRNNNVASSGDNVLGDGIAVQLVVDSNSRILSVVAGFRSGKDDVAILKSTTLYRDIEEGRLLNSSQVSANGVVVNQYLVGDIGYPLLSWLMVPFSESGAPGSFEDRFNKAVELMRVSALRTIGSLKNWGVLGKPMEEDVKTAVAMIGACSILHNALLMREDFSALMDVDSYSCFEDYSGFSDSTVKENSGGSRAFDIRSALATRVAELHAP